ncbi:hypothetical protein ACFYZB_40115, partial [Streptomyces sp. NPDC001852]
MTAVVSKVGGHVANNQDGRLEVFTRASNGTLWHLWQTVPNNGWSNWAGLGGYLMDGDPPVVMAGEPSVFQNEDGRLEVFARGTDGAMWHVYQTM